MVAINRVTGDDTFVFLHSSQLLFLTKHQRANGWSEHTSEAVVNKRANRARSNLHKSGMTLLSWRWSFKSKFERRRATLMGFKINALTSPRRAGWWVSYPCTFHSAEIITSPHVLQKIKSGDQRPLCSNQRLQEAEPGWIHRCAAWKPAIVAPCPDAQQRPGEAHEHWGKYLAVIGVRVISVIWGSWVSVRLNSREHKYRDDLIWWYNSSTDGE